MDIIARPSSELRHGFSARDVRHIALTHLDLDHAGGLHCGDAYLSHRELAEPPSCPGGLKVFQKLVAWNDKLRLANQARLREGTASAA